MGIYSIKKFGMNSGKGRDRVGVGIRSSYIRVLGIQVDTDGSGELLKPSGHAFLFHGRAQTQNLVHTRQIFYH